MLLLCSIGFRLVTLASIGPFQLPFIMVSSDMLSIILSVSMWLCLLMSYDVLLLKLLSSVFCCFVVHVLECGVFAFVLLFVGLVCSRSLLLLSFVSVSCCAGVIRLLCFCAAKSQSYLWESRATGWSQTDGAFTCYGFHCIFIDV